MKKLLLVAAIRVAGLVSAKETNFNQFKTYVSMIGGWFEIKIYRINSDGSKTLVDYSYTYEESQSACNAKASLMLFEAQK